MLAIFIIIPTLNIRKLKLRENNLIIVIQLIKDRAMI